jgi:hypothetical protein
MKNFKAENGAVLVSSGQVKLSAEQAQDRMHCLRAVDVKKDGAGVYQVIAAIHFKQGETFGFDGEIGRNGVLSDPDAEQLATLEADEKRLAEATVAIRKKAEAEAEARIDAVRKQTADEIKKLGEQVVQAQADCDARLKDAAAGEAARVETACNEAREALLSALKPETAELVRAELAAG